MLFLNRIALAVRFFDLLKSVMKEKGYVYILTNPAFRENWVKIGRSSRPVDVRSKELDNTAVPLPFEIYATMCTEKYIEAEKLVHKYIERFTNLRIRDNREFFNVKPEEALEIFYDVQLVIDDAEIEVFADVPLKKCKQRAKKIQTTPECGETKTEQNSMKGKTSYLLNGKTFHSMSACLRELITLFIKKHKDISYDELKLVFNDNLLERRHRIRGLLFKKEDYDAWTRSDKEKRYGARQANALLSTSDGIQFYVNTQWTQTSFKNILNIAKKEGFRILINS